MENTFRALRIWEDDTGKVIRKIETRNISDLPEGDVLIKVKYAALNYKDALSATGNKGVTRKYPHTPGIDAAGIVAECSDGTFKEGDEVLVTGYDLGMNTDGGFAEYVRVPSGWVVPLPEGMGLKESMSLGTAGLTAGIGLHKMLTLGQTPEMGPVVVTGATGGVGSMAVSMLASAGFEVWASTGKIGHEEYLKKLGAKKIVNREFVNDDTGKPLLKPQWAGAFDAVGGNTLATLLKGCMREGTVASCGLVSSPTLSTTVFPFILNGINLVGIDSATFPMKERLLIWEKMAAPWKPNHLEDVAKVISLEELEPYIHQILNGEISGRTLIRL